MILRTKIQFKLLSKSLTILATLPVSLFGPSNDAAIYRMAAAYGRPTARHKPYRPRAPTRHLISDFIRSKIMNPASVLYNTTCKFHVSDAGNECFFGPNCHYLHFKCLHRPPRLAAQVQHPSQVMETLQREVNRQGRILDLLTCKLKLSEEIVSIDEEEPCAVLEPVAEAASIINTHHAPAQPKAASSSHKAQRTTTAATKAAPSPFAARLSSAFANKKAKSSARKAKKKKAQKRKSAKAQQRKPTIHTKHAQHNITAQRTNQHLATPNNTNDTTSSNAR